MTTTPPTPPADDDDKGAAAPAVTPPAPGAISTARTTIAEALDAVDRKLNDKRRERERVNSAIAQLVTEHAELTRTLNALDRPKRAAKAKAATK